MKYKYLIVNHESDYRSSIKVEHRDTIMPLERMQEIVGGYVELQKVKLKGQWMDAMINEEGIPKELEENEVTS